MEQIKIKNKKAGLPPMEAVIGAVVLILSIVLIFMIIKNALPTTSSIDKATCSASVATRSAASSSFLKTEFRDIVPLRCKTDKICLVSGNSEGCQGLGKDYQKIQVDGDKQKILEAIGQNIYEWHVTLGSGEKNFMPRGFTDSTYCFRNSLISFDSNTQNELKNKGITITMYDYYAWMYNKKTDDGKSYLEALSGTNDLSIIQGSQNILLDVSSPQIVVTQVIEDGKFWQVATTLGFGGGALVVTAKVGTLLIPGVGWLRAAKIAWTAIKIGTAASGVTWLVAGKDPNSPLTYHYRHPSLMPFNQDTLKELDCDEWETIG